MRGREPIHSFRMTRARSYCSTVAKLDELVVEISKNGGTLLYWEIYAYMY